MRVLVISCGKMAKLINVQQFYFDDNKLDQKCVYVWHIKTIEYYEYIWNVTIKADTEHFR